MIAFGPEAPGFGSWEWIGEDLCRQLGEGVATTFRERIPPCDVIVFVKFKPAVEQLRQLKRQAKLVYCPVDIYGSAQEIDDDWQSLRLFDAIIAHARPLMKYFQSYARVDYLDHHTKFFSALPNERKTSGPILWTGNAANLPPVVEYLNRHKLPDDLWLLTDIKDERTSPAEYGFNNLNTVRIENWTPERHHDWAGLARAAIDIKGSDFRSRHKPPTKAFDFIASGLPLAMNSDSSSVREVARWGLQLASPSDVEHWLSEDYWQQIQALGQQLREQLTLETIASRFIEIIRTL